jgi:allophanate hydrolase subunit 2
MADAQTTGGYPKLGVVIRADLWKLGQLRLGGSLRFISCSVDEARTALRQRQALLDQLRTALCMSI